ncbi:MAG: hypothetical protein AAF089_17415 [Bacteroidota bacterium]
MYIDARTLGSSNEFTDQSRSLNYRCSALFGDILRPIADSLLEAVVDKPTNRQEKALEGLDTFLDALRVSRTTVRMTEQRAKELAQDRSGLAGKAQLEATGLSVEMGAESSATRETEKEVKYEAVHEERVEFPTVHAALNDVLVAANFRLYVLIDEWSSIPIDLQPYLGEFLKRTVIPNPRSTLKIAALEYRSRFTISRDKIPFGLELGADIATAMDLDDYYVYDRNPEAVATAYADILFRHIEVELPEDYLAENYRIASGDDLASRMFTQRPTFKELARASEGVIRDLINIFNASYYSAQRKGRETIERKSVLSAARDWFEQDKARHLTDEMQKVLRRIVDDVIGHRNARSFMIPRSLEHHDMIQRLIDARVVHHVRRGYADKDNPGVRYNIYTLDYGTYVDLVDTKNAPQIELIEVNESGNDPEVVVPFDDHRSIRRIVLREDLLNL